jgi:acyl-CoA synthetase (NDP forming)
MQDSPLPMDIERFNPLFQARSVALIGASSSPRKWGHVMLKNLINGGFPGNIYPINPDSDELLGKKVYKTLEAVPETPDLAIIVVPTKAILEAVQDCVDKGVKAAVVITAGFAELGDEGKRLQDQMVETAHKAGMVLVGPNCNGIMSPWAKLYVDFPSYHVPPGGIATVCQSGGIVDGLAREIMNKGLGCSICVASGNEADLHIEDYLAYMAEDPHTKVIICYIEGFQDGDRFYRIAREVTRKKPIVAYKAGKTAAGAKAAMSHTASIAGTDAIFDGICRQAGIIRAKNLDHMFNLGTAFLNQPLPKGPVIAIVTAGGGWGVMAADECVSLGLEMASLSPETIKKLDAFLPAWWNRGNPVDLVAGSDPDDVLRVVDTVLESPDVDAVIYIGLMPAMKFTEQELQQRSFGSESWGNAVVRAAVDVAERLGNLSRKYKKPVVIASEHLISSAEQEIRTLRAIGQSGGVCYRMPYEAAEVMAALVSYGRWVNADGK